jgi:hypothetical protein
VSRYIYFTNLKHLIFWNGGSISLYICAYFFRFFEVFKIQFSNVQNKGLQWTREPNWRTLMVGLQVPIIFFFCNLQDVYLFSFFALRCICILYLKFIFWYILKMLKNSKQKCFVYTSILYVSTKSFQETLTFYVIYVKMTKFGTKISLLKTCFLSSLQRPRKISPFHKTLHEYIECDNIHAHIFP